MADKQFVHARRCAASFAERSARSCYFYFAFRRISAATHFAAMASVNCAARPNGAQMAQLHARFFASCRCASIVKAPAAQCRARYFYRRRFEKSAKKSAEAP